MNLTITQLNDLQEAQSNKVYVSPNLFSSFLKQNNNQQPIYVNIKGYPYVLGSSKIEDNCVALSKKQRQFLNISPTFEKVDMKLFHIPQQEYRLSLLKLAINPSLTRQMEIKGDELGQYFLKLYASQFFSENQVIFLEFKDIRMFVQVEKIMLMENEAKKVDLPFGLLVKETEIEFTSLSSLLKVKSASNKTKNIFRADFKFEDMGVGGLNKEIQNIFRRAFSSRRLPQNILDMYGIKHVKGLILYGPPGTGKTLIARQLGKALHSKEPKIVNGPELFNKFVGQTEENVRALFEDAKRDQQTLQEESPLHIIIFDEFESIARHRGSTSGGTGVSDNIVNQLLAMIDGVDSLNNILVIGMTNRLDLIDTAILRPGRFEVHVEVNLPDEEGRVEILQIHTKIMQQNKLLASDVDLKEIAKLLKNYTGAEIEAIVKSANSFALNRKHNLMDFSKQLVIDKAVQVEKRDFLLAYEEIKPEFGVDESKMEIYTKSTIYNYGTRFQKLMSDCQQILTEIEKNQVPLASTILYGQTGTGKTTLAVKLATSSSCPFIKFITAEDLIGMSELYKVNYINKCFEDAYKSKQSVIILDDMERLVEYVDIGKRFSNSLLQAIMVLLKKLPSKSDHSIAIIATSSSVDFLKEFGLYYQFNIKVEIPELRFNANGENEITTVVQQKLNQSIKGYLGMPSTFKISMKKLLFTLHLMANTKKGNLESDFKEAIRIVGGEERQDHLTEIDFQ